MHCLEKFTQYDIILASQSPRRKALLEGAGIPFRILARPTAELFPEHLPPAGVVAHLCRQKISCFGDELKRPGVVVITADTIVVQRGKIINKPAGAEQAFDMLSELSGSTHEVYTGVCIRHGDDERVFCDHSLVTFRKLAAEEISYYIEHYAPYDKAGAYGIQEWIGYIGITGIQGSYHNVMGLPVHKVYEALKEMLCR